MPSDPKINLRISADTKTATSKMQRFATAIRGVGVAAAAYIGFDAARSFVSFVAKAEDEEQKFRQVFRSMETEMINWANTFSKTFGRTTVDIHAFTSTIGDVLKPMGFITSEAARMSKELVKLGLDLAAFNNKSDPDAVHALTAALTGEREMLKQLGVVILDVDVKRKIAEMGLKTHTSELRKQATALATLQLLNEQSADAQGTLEREQKGLTNQVKVLTASMLGLLVAVKDKLAPALAKILSTISDLINGYKTVYKQSEEFRQGIEALTYSAKGLAISFVAGFTALTKLVQVMIKVIGILPTLARRIRDVIAGTEDASKSTENYIKKMEELDDEYEKIIAGQGQYAEQIKNIRNKQAALTDEIAKSRKELQKLKDEQREKVEGDEVEDLKRLYEQRIKLEERAQEEGERLDEQRARNAERIADLEQGALEKINDYREKLLSRQSSEKLDKIQKEMHEEYAASKKLIDEEKAAFKEREDEQKKIHDQSVKDLIRLSAFIKETEEKKLQASQSFDRAREQAHEDEVERIKREFLTSQTESKKAAIEEMSEDQKKHNELINQRSELEQQEKDAHNARRDRLIEINDLRLKEMEFLNKIIALEKQLAEGLKTRQQVLTELNPLTMDFESRTFRGPHGTVHSVTRSGSAIDEAEARERGRRDASSRLTSLFNVK